MFVNQSLFTKKDQFPGLLDFFSWRPDSKARRLVLVGEQGTGKTTAVRRATYAWCQHVSKRKSVKESLTNFTSKIMYFTNIGTSSMPEWEIEDEANEQEDLVEVKPIFPWMIQEDAKAVEEAEQRAKATRRAKEEREKTEKAEKAAKEEALKKATEENWTSWFLGLMTFLSSFLISS